MDVERLVAHNDGVCQAPAREGWKDLPLGNGTLGALTRGSGYSQNTIDKDCSGCIALT